MTLTPEVKAEFVKLGSALDPEALYCDGLVSQAQAKAEGRKLMRRWRALEAEHSVHVTEEDAHSWLLEELGVDKYMQPL